MDRKGIRIERTDLRERNRLAAKHYYKTVAGTEQLSGTITSSPEYNRWQEFFGDLVEDLYFGTNINKIPMDKIGLLWVPGSPEVGQKLVKDIDSFLETHKNFLQNF